MIRVFVGTKGNDGNHKFHEDAEKVLEYSIRKNTAQDVDLTFMRPDWETPPTGFASHRYLIPKLCNWEGYAIYLDVDMLVLADLSELWEYKRKGRWCVTDLQLKKMRDEVSVIDCSAFKDLPNEQALKTRQGKNIARNIIGSRYLMNIVDSGSPRIRAIWNASSLERCPKAKLIHYTNLECQPWRPDPTIKYKPYGCQQATDLFFEYLEKAND